MILVNFDGLEPSAIARQLATATEAHQIAFWQFLQEFYDSSDTFASQTSGSTGVPKLCTILKDHALHSADASIAYFGIDSTHTLLLAMDIKYIGAKMLVVRAIRAKASLVVVKPKAHVFDQINWSQVSKIDMVSMSPNQVYVSLEQDASSFQHISKVLIGGGVISPALYRLIQKCTSTSFYESFGMTETISHFAIKPLDGFATSFAVLDGFRIATDRNECLVVSHPLLLPEDVVTQDVVQLIDDRHFVWKGRKDFVVISGGVKIYPEAVERELAHVIHGDFVLVGVPDDALGQCLAMVYTEEIDEAAMIQEIKKVVSHPYFVPKKYRRVRQLEFTENGKIKRAPLKELFN